MELNKIYQGDCLEVMKGIEDNSIDLVLVDPPYGINYQSNFRKESFNKIENDSSVSLDFIDYAYTVLKDGCAMYLFTRWDVYEEWYNKIKEKFKIKNCIVWYKRGGGIGDLKGAYMFNHEFCIFAVKGRHILNNKRVSDVWEIKKDAPSKYKHPTQKPVELFEKIIVKSSNEGDVVLDPFAGSGTTGVACKNLNRNYILIEQDENYCKIAEERLLNTPLHLQSEETISELNKLIK